MAKTRQQRQQSAQPSDPSIKQGTITKPVVARKTSRAASNQPNVHTIHQPRKPQPKPKTTAAKPTSSKPPPAKPSKPAAGKPPARQPSASTAPPAKDPTDDTPDPETESGVAPALVPSYYPRVVVKGNNILLSGPWTVRKYSNDFENGKERLELDRLKAVIGARAEASRASRREHENTPDLGRYDFEDPNRHAAGRSSRRDDNANEDGRQPVLPSKDKGKTPLYRLDRTQRFAVKHKDHGGGIFDPSNEGVTPMPRDPLHLGSRYTEPFTIAHGTKTEGYRAPQKGQGGWHFMLYGTGDSDNMHAHKMMGGKGFFEPDTDWPTAENVQAYRDYLRTYPDPEVDNPTEGIWLVWRHSGLDQDPHNLLDDSDDEADRRDDTGDDASQGPDHDPQNPAGEQGDTNAGLRFSGSAGRAPTQQEDNDASGDGGVSPLSIPCDDQVVDQLPSIETKAAETTQQLLNATKPERPFTKKRNSQAATDQPSDQTTTDRAEEQRPNKRARHYDRGCSGGEAHRIPISPCESTTKAWTSPPVGSKTITGHIRKKGGRHSVGNARGGSGQLLEASNLMSPGDFDRIYGRKGFK